MGDGTAIEMTGDVCRHDLAVGYVLHLQARRQASRVLTGGGSHFHARRDCGGLLDGQRRIEVSGGRTEPVEMVHRGSARLEGRDPCTVCAPP